MKNHLEKSFTFIAVFTGFAVIGYVYFRSSENAFNRSIPQQYLIALDNSVFDFGRSSQEKELEHVFRLKNNASVPVEIFGIRSSRGCTWAPETEDLISATMDRHQLEEVLISLPQKR